MITPVKPLGFNVLVKIIPVETKTKSGIVITSSENEERERKGRDIAEVIEFGPVAFKGYAGCDSAADWERLSMTSGLRIIVTLMIKTLWGSQAVSF